MDSEAVIQTLKGLKQKLVKAYAIESLAVFGSFAKGNPRKRSDVDILVSFKKPIGWAFFDLQEELELALGRKVDLVTPNALKSVIREEILREARYI
jgi:uncharacterized protein